MGAVRALRLRVTIPSVVLGIPIPGSNNPVLSAPISEEEVLLRVEKCENPLLGLEGVPARLRGLLDGFWENLLAGLRESLCADIKVDGAAPTLNSSGAYPALTAALVYSVARYYGDRLSPSDIIELSSYSDPGDLDEAWGNVVNSMRLASVTGRVSVYRGLEEYMTFSSERIRARLVGSRVVSSPRVGRDHLGSDLYGALIHLAGVMVVEASIKLREGRSLEEVLGSFKPLHEGLAYAVWGLYGESDNCLWEPGVKGVFDYICLGDG